MVYSFLTSLHRTWVKLIQCQPGLRRWSFRGLLMNLPGSGPFTHLALILAHAPIGDRRIPMSRPKIDRKGEVSHVEREPFLTLTVVAEQLGIPVFKIRRAAKRGLFPTYFLLNGRKLARLSEVEAAIERSCSGGANV